MTFRKSSEISDSQVKKYLMSLKGMAACSRFLACGSMDRGSLAGYSQWGRKQSDMAEQLSTQHTDLILCGLRSHPVSVWVGPRRRRCQESIKGARDLLEEMLTKAEGVKEQQEAKTVIPSESCERRERKED